MESIVLSKAGFASLDEIADWCNGLVGHYATTGGHPRLVEKVIYFQVLPRAAGYDVLILAEVIPVE
jgi:hypothetical protein